jgi:hypothetical protein
MQQRLSLPTRACSLFRRGPFDLLTLRSSDLGRYRHPPPTRVWGGLGAISVLSLLSYPFNLVAQGWRLVFAEGAAVYHQHSESLGRYLRRKWRHGYWRVRVYRRHPRKALGDSYTPRSTQLQFLGTVAAVFSAPMPRLRVVTLGGALVFALGTLPFVRRAWPMGGDVAVATPVLLFLRSLALGAGLGLGLLTLFCAGRLAAPGFGRIAL